MKARLVANISLAKYDEEKIPIQGIYVSFEAIETSKDGMLILKSNWKDYQIGGTHADTRSNEKIARAISG